MCALNQYGQENPMWFQECCMNFVHCVQMVYRLFNIGFCLSRHSQLFYDYTSFNSPRDFFKALLLYILKHADLHAITVQHVCIRTVEE